MKSFSSIVQQKFKYVLNNLQTTNIEEVDVWLGFLPGCDYLGVRAG
jgi:hypothetical protein